MTWSILDRTHCLACVAEQIQNDLLQLHAIASNSRQTILEFLFQNYIVSLKLARQQSNDLASYFIQIEWLNVNRLLAEERPQSLNHV
jgi:hypothetical protein